LALWSLSSLASSSLLLVKWCVEGTFSLGRQSRQMPSLAILPVQDRRVGSHSIVPADHRALLPLHACLEISAEGYMVVEEFQQVIALFLLQSNDPSGELWVDIERFLACSRMSPNERMNIGDWLPSNDGSACSSIRRLLVAGVDGLKTVQTLLEFRTQSVMRLDHIPE